MDLGLQGVHVLITGASGGIGMETAHLFLSQGANVTVHGNSNIGPIRDLMEKIGKDRVHCVMADLSDEEKVEKIFAWSESHVQFGPVQVLVVNHGIWLEHQVPVADMTLDQWNMTIQTNLTSSFLVCREYLKRLREEPATDKLREKASIVLIGSTSGKIEEAGHADYAASKSAMMYGLTMSLKNEIVKIAPKGRVNCVTPGWVKTPMTANSLKDPDLVYQELASIPLKKIATPRDVANQVVILASSSVSGHVSGQVVMVDGGMGGSLLNNPEDIGR